MFAPAIRRLYLTILSRLKCDRALPACGNCLDRTEITDCRYVSRKAVTRTKLQASSELSGAAKDRIDHLEHLLLRLLNSQPRTLGPVDTLSNYSEKQNDPNFNQTIAQDSALRRDGDVRLNDETTMTSLPQAQNEIRICADHNQRLYVDEAHWALLLNEVRIINGAHPLTYQHN